MSVACIQFNEHEKNMEEPGRTWKNPSRVVSVCSYEQMDRRWWGAGRRGAREAKAKIGGKRLFLESHIYIIT